MKTELKNSIYAGLVFGIIITLVLVFLYNIGAALAMGSFAGVAFGGAVYLFINSKEIAQQTALNSNETSTIIYSGGANHFIGVEGAGGKLYLLADKIQFKSHNFNVQNHEMTTDLCDIDEVGFYRTLGLVPNGLYISTTDGKTQKFVVHNRNKWKEKIEEQKNRVVSF